MVFGFGQVAAKRTDLAGLALDRVTPAPQLLLDPGVRFGERVLRVTGHGVVCLAKRKRIFGQVIHAMAQIGLGNSLELRNPGMMSGEAGPVGRASSADSEASTQTEVATSAHAIAPQKRFVFLNTDHR